MIKPNKEKIIVFVDKAIIKPAVDTHARPAIAIAGLVPLYVKAIISLPDRTPTQNSETNNALVEIDVFSTFTKYSLIHDVRPTSAPTYNSRIVLHIIRMLILMRGRDLFFLLMDVRFGTIR